MCGLQIKAFEEIKKAPLNRGHQRSPYSDFGTLKKASGLSIQEVRPVASRWFSCLKAIAAIALLVKDADKLTLEQQMAVVASHTFESSTQKPSD